MARLCYAPLSSLHRLQSRSFPGFPRKPCWPLMSPRLGVFAMDFSQGFGAMDSILLFNIVFNHRLLVCIGLVPYYYFIIG
jgi:hypothetical protein